MKESNWPEWSCPVHRKPLINQGDTLSCSNGDSFSVKDAIPRFVSKSDYAEAFGAQWRRYRLTQLDSYTGTTITRDRARRCLGEELWDELSGKQVLECGCGAGRFSEILLDRGAYVTSIDLSEAVDANGENFPIGDKHRIAQADIRQLPFASQQFDVVFCLGVVQHTPNPEEAIACLYDQVKPGGVLVIDHYTYSISGYTKILAPLFWLYLRRLPPKEGILWTEWLVDTLLPLHKAVRRFYPAQMFLSRLSPVRCYYHAYPELSDELQQEWAFLDTHDSLTPQFKHSRTPGKIRNTLERLSLRAISCEKRGYCVEARGERPSL
jgi:SAM-dependent methyltransferase